MKYFSYSPDKGVSFHKSAATARKAAQRAIEEYGDDANEEGWPEDTEEICWGELRQRAAQTNVRTPDPEEDGTAFEEICDYELKDIDDAKADPPNAQVSGPGQATTKEQK